MRHIDFLRIILDDLALLYYHRHAITRRAKRLPIVYNQPGSCTSCLSEVALVIPSMEDKCKKSSWRIVDNKLSTLKSEKTTNFAGVSPRYFPCSIVLQVAYKCRPGVSRDRVSHQCLTIVAQVFFLEQVLAECCSGVSSYQVSIRRRLGVFFLSCVSQVAHKCRPSVVIIKCRTSI